MINIYKRYLFLFVLPIIFLSVVNPVVSQTVERGVSEETSSLVIMEEEFVNDSHQESQNAFEDTLELNEFAHAKYAYATKYPKAWNMHDIPSMSYTRFENKVISSDLHDHADASDYFKIEVVVLPRNGMFLDEWVRNQNTTSYPLPEVHEQQVIEVDGNKAIYQIEQFGNLVKPAIFIEKGEYVYIINPSNNKRENKAVLNLFLRDFKFTN